MVQNAEFFIFIFIYFIFIVVGFVFLYILDMDSMNKENDEYGDTISSAPKRMRCRTFSIWSDFETMLSFEIVRAYGEKNNLIT